MTSIRSLAIAALLSAAFISGCSCDGTNTTLPDAGDDSGTPINPGGDGGEIDAGFDALAPTGRLILYGAASGRPDPVDPHTLESKGSLYLQRPTLNTYTRTPELLRERAAAVFALIAAGDLDVRIGARYPLEDARRALEDLEARRTTGKLLLVP